MTPRAEGSSRTSAPGAVLWLIPLALALHNAEEAATFSRYVPLVRARLPAFAQPLAAQLDMASLRAALVWVTIVPFVVVAWATARPASLVARWSALAVQAVVALNVVSHAIMASVLLRGYSPGLITALAVNAPLSVVVFDRAAREQWIPRWSWWLLPPTAFLLHGPGVIALLLLA